MPLTTKPFCFRDGEQSVYFEFIKSKYETNLKKNDWHEFNKVGKFDVIPETILITFLWKAKMYNKNHCN